MVRKPGKMYRNLAKKAYTRKEYMGGIPGSKVVQFDMGNLTDEFPVQLSLAVEEGCQIRHTALEAARISINRRLIKDVGRMNYRLKLRVYPHHVLRENKQATGAGADRVSEGMRLAFGKAVGTAARVMPGQEVFSVYTTPQFLDKGKGGTPLGKPQAPVANPDHHPGVACFKGPCSRTGIILLFFQGRFQRISCPFFRATGDSIVRPGRSFPSAGNCTFSLRDGRRRHPETGQKSLPAANCSNPPPGCMT